MGTEIDKIIEMFKKKFPNYPVLAIWNAGNSYLVSIEIKSGNELMDGFFKVGKRYMKINESWGYQDDLDWFKRVIKTPAIYLK